ncbi:MAG TPA: hypothetical protein VFY10_02530, partial [Dehalococcoidia bacterium]|nr:hypothetical protein [Dehalococcoidia bacterium]
MTALSVDLSNTSGIRPAVAGSRPSLLQLLLACAVWLFVSVSAELALSNAAPTGLVVIDWLGGFVWFATGVVVWLRRPRTYFGPLMMLIGLIWFNDHFRATGSGWMAVYVSFTSGAAGALIAYLVFTYPAGRVGRGFERLFVIGFISYLLVFNV